MLLEPAECASEGITATMAATDFAPAGPISFMPVLSDASLVSLLLCSEQMERRLSSSGRFLYIVSQIELHT